jgi:hypothetical protein
MTTYAYSEIFLGTVESSTDETNTGVLMCSLPFPHDDGLQEVVYCSPFYKYNGGGIVAIPTKGDKILVAKIVSEDPEVKPFYYLGTAISQPVPEAGKVDTKMTPFRSEDRPIYGSRNKPVTQTFTNIAGAGLYVTRDINGKASPPRITNEVTLKAESGNMISTGSTGTQIRNEHGDCIILNGEGTDNYGGRSLNISTRSDQEYRSEIGDVTMKVLDGGDINIINDSTGWNSIGAVGATAEPPAFPTVPKPPDVAGGLFPWSGNVRLKSKWRNIDLAAEGPMSKINIVTNTAKIQVDALTGSINIFGGTSLSLNSLGSISLNAATSISLNAGGFLSLNSVGLTSVNSGTVTNISSAGTTNIEGAITFGGIPITTINPAGTSQTPYVPSPIVPPVPPVPIPPGPNDYLDGTQKPDTGLPERGF